MKIQHLAVIFVIIVLPISLVLSVYTGNLIKVSNKEAAYNTLLLNSTYDAVRAYQMNTLKNRYSSESDSRVRDITASTNSFFNSLATGLSQSGYSRNDLNSYIPAILYTLYDGYYIYSCYQNIVTVNSGTPKYSTNSEANDTTEYGLKSYIYYTCEYKKNGSYDIIVNYTLDNYITIYGTYIDLNGKTNYITAGGYYINTNGITNSGDKHYEITKNNKTTIIEPEMLGEYESTIDNYYDSVLTSTEYVKSYGVRKNDIKYYNYIVYNGNKYYYDDENATDANKQGEIEGIKQYATAEEYMENKATDTNIKYKKFNIGSQTINASFNNSYSGIPIFRLENNLRIYINEQELETIISYLSINKNEAINKSEFKDVNACYYYKNAVNFSNKVYPILKQIDAKQDVITESYNMKYTPAITGITEKNETTTHTKTNYSTSHIFDYSQKDNDPETEESSFNQHRIDVIISSIESSLINSMENFNNYTASTFEYSLPVLSESDWYTITNNLTVVSFMQGLTVGNYKYYSNYSVVANTKNNELAQRDSIYIQEDYQKNGIGIDDMRALYSGTYTENGNAIESIYHDPRCLELSQNLGTKYAIGYKNTDYDINTFTYTPQEYYSDQSDNKYIYDGNIHSTSNTAQNENYYIQPGTSGYECIVSKDDNNFTTDDIILGRDIKIGETTYKINENVRNAYIIAMARIKATIYKLSNNL